MIGDIEINTNLGFSCCPFSKQQSMFVSTLGFEIEVATCVMSEGMEHSTIGMTT